MSTDCNACHRGFSGLLVNPATFRESSWVNQQVKVKKVVKVKFFQVFQLGSQLLSDVRKFFLISRQNQEKKLATILKYIYIF